jgi:transcriptional regulator with XRE-family HTH domain
MDGEGGNWMSFSTGTAARAEKDAGDLLRYWRRQRGQSQLDLSLDTGVSQRHIRFVESGRSEPSRELLLGLAKALDVPLREQNVLLPAWGMLRFILKACGMGRRWRWSAR